MPLLRGHTAAQARAALGALSARYLRLRASELPDDSLASGLSGIALVHAGLDNVFADAGHGARAARALERALEALARQRRPGLYFGMSGVAWTVAHLVQDASEEADGPCVAIDAALHAYLRSSPWTDPFDLFDGLVGIGVYALERLPRPLAKRILMRVVDHLDETARRLGPGIAWWSDATWLRRTQGYVNLGMAHGVPGVIALLGLIVAADVDVRTTKKARARLDGAVTSLLAQELPRGAGSCFGYTVTPREAPRPARLAWCYGDLGIAASLLVAARAVGERGWERTALRIALRAAARTEATSGVVDAGLCHGAAGVGHVFHRLFRATADKRFADAARFWFARVLALRDRRGFGGFRASIVDEKAEEKMVWRADPGFLEGAGGVALALVAATADVEPAWDRVLLLS